MGEIIHLNEEEVKSQLSEMVRETVEKTLNQLLDAEADEITQAHRYERTEERVDTRAGHYHRKLVTKAGTMDIKVPKLRKLPFETGIIERYKTQYLGRFSLFITARIHTIPCAGSEVIFLYKFQLVSYNSTFAVGYIPAAFLRLL